MKFEGTKVFGFENAIIGMRLPMSYSYIDAKLKVDSSFNSLAVDDKQVNDGRMGENDCRICRNLIKEDELFCGQPNSKFLRMIHVQVAVTAPLYFYKEMDTYKVGTVANSTSTMHKLASTPITFDCFEHDDYNGDNIIEHEWNDLIIVLESLRNKSNNSESIEDKKRYWKELIRMLPESWLQTRMFDCNYQVLRNIYRSRKNHKLTEWHSFCRWIESLPYAKELICA